MGIKLDSSCASEPDILVCPSCGNLYLHQHKVEVYWRHVEDSISRRDVSKGAGVNCTLDADNNPSPRRNGILIWFTCETCASKVYMAVVQHKGNTLVDTGFLKPSKD